jgi:hypothetical protein
MVPTRRQLFFNAGQRRKIGIHQLQQRSVSNVLIYYEVGTYSSINYELIISKTSTITIIYDTN